MAEIIEIPLTVGLLLSIRAAYLIYDLATGCTAMRSSGGAPCVVMPPPGAPAPKTRGQMSNSAVEELLHHGLVEPAADKFPQRLKLTPWGEAYYRHQVRSRWRPGK